MFQDPLPKEAFSAENFLEMGEKAQSLANDFISSQFSSFEKLGSSPVSGEMLQLWRSWLSNPQAILSIHQNFWQAYAKLLENSVDLFCGITSDPVIEAEGGDRRFSDEEWNDHPLFNHIKQLYLLASRCVLAHFAVNEGMDDKTAKKMEFFAKQWVDALSPTNFAATNPEVMKETLDSSGANLLQGFKALLDDLQRGKGEHLMTRMTDFSAFEIGKNIASTKGKVIFENDLFQLLQYSPTTKTVFERPLLIVPPWINKYYILDLSPENSFIQWAVDQGHTVFIISWCNPDEDKANKTFEDYMTEGVVTAMEQVKKETGVSAMNTIGYCVGGTLLAATNAWLTAKRKKLVHSTTYFTTMIDFENPGDLGVFIDEEQLDSLDADMAKEGYLDGTSMASVFNMLRANDLIWPFFINNYLLGKDPASFDILYWNSDSTRLPAANHSYYLRTCYLNNLLREPGGIILADIPIDISKVKTPTYFISTKGDHITPWKSTYAGAKLFSGPVRFVLGGSGHIAGIINPPTKNKYFYMTNDELNPDADTWFENAKTHEGSWWGDWQSWVKKQAGKKIPAREPGVKLGVLDDAPGSYVKKRIVPD